QPLHNRLAAQRNTLGRQGLPNTSHVLSNPALSVSRQSLPSFPTLVLGHKFRSSKASRCMLGESSAGIVGLKAIISVTQDAPESAASHTVGPQLHRSAWLGRTIAIGLGNR